MRGLEAATRDILDRRLRTDSPRPLALALSGGGDSVALALMVDGWARAVGRDLVILTVDHRLRPESAIWVQFCTDFARRLDRPFQVLDWIGEKPETGLPAAARRARHALLADAAREHGARVLFMGHTADDAAEAAAMRAEGSTAPDPREWRPSPAWPEGRGLFLLRPLLHARRADLRQWLKERGEAWIDDPANSDLRFARARARSRTPPASVGAPEPILTLAEAVTEDAGVLRLPRNVLRDARAADASRLVALMAVCAGGTDRIPARDRADRLTSALVSPGPVRASLAGARIEADADAVHVFREAGEVARGGLAPIQAPGVWDGRFEIAASGEVRRLRGLARKLPASEQAALRRLPAAAQGGLPVLMTSDGVLTCPAAGERQSLVGARLRAAAGLVQWEPD